MREIKFRAWRIDFEQWEYFDLHQLMLGQSFCLYENWCQYTGLHDKNGKEIYEGDIIRWNETGYVASVRYEGGWFVVGECGEPIMVYVQEAIEDDEFDTKKDGRNSEVIGNIYENPELLEKA